jgi:predicted AAA+ superfamily ATPase
MEGEKPKIFLVGSSHAKRIGFQMSEIDQKDFLICNYGKSGLKVKDLKLPHAGVTEKDIMIVSILGNDYIKNSPKKIVNGTRTKYVLEHLEPVTTNGILQLFSILQSKLQTVPCKVYIVDTFYRHLLYPTKAVKLQAYNLFKKRNLMLENFFFLQGIKVLRHRTLFEKKDLRPSRTIQGYAQLLSKDDVHLKKSVYASVANRLLETIKNDIG